MPKVLLIAWERFSEINYAFTDKQYQPEEIQELMSKLLEDVRNINEELYDYTNSLSWNRPIFYDNNEHSREYLEKSSKAITPVLPTEEPEYSLSMGDEHLSTILETESDELIKSSVENLVPILSEYEVTSDNKSECDVPVKDESSLVYTTFSNPFFDCTDDFTSSDDESLSNEDVSMGNFKIYLNPPFDDEEIISNKIDPRYFNAKSNLIESLPNQDTLFYSSPKFDYLKELSGELMPTSIINEERIKREHEEYISLMEKLLTINSFPRPLENFHANTIIETLPTSPIPVDDSDSLREEIDIFTGMDDLMPSGSENDNYDSEGDIHILEELLSNDSPPLSENESSNFDHHDDLSFPRPPPEPSDVLGIKCTRHSHYQLWSSHCQEKFPLPVKKVPTARKKEIPLLIRLYSYEVPANATTTGTTSDGTGKKKGRTVTLTADDMQKRKNDVKARTTLLLSLPDEHQLRFSKYKTAQELWAAILKTFGGNEATKKTKKNLLKQQYGNFKAEGSETLEQTFNRLQVIVSQLQFMDVEIEQDDLNQNFLTSLAPEWLMHTILWRNKSDLDTMSLDDLYNHLKVYESEV
nr:hypothetical protein [Tanacetum cinerariifolium]